MNQPIHVERPVDQKAKGHVADLSLLLDASDDRHESDKVGDQEHTVTIPDPAGVMRDEVSRGVVKHLALTTHDFLFLVEGTDDTHSSHLLMEVRVDGMPQTMTHFVKLVVGGHVGNGDFVGQESHQG